MIPTILNDLIPPTTKGQVTLGDNVEEDITLQFAAVLDAVEESDPKLENAVLRSDLAITVGQLTNADGENPSSIETDGTPAEFEAEQIGKAESPNLFLKPEEATKRSQTLPIEAQTQAKPSMVEKPTSQPLGEQDLVAVSIQTVSRTTVAQSVLEGRMPIMQGPRAQLALTTSSSSGHEKNDATVAAQGESKPTPLVSPHDLKKTASQVVLATQALDARRILDSEGDRGAAPINTEYDMRSTKASAMVVPTSSLAMFPAMPQLSMQQLDPAKSVPEIDGLLVASSPDRIGATTQSLSSIASNVATDTARHIAQQIAVSVTNTGGRITEISLNPEELGRVRMTMSAADGAMTLHLSAERPETQDLLRRHIEVLAQEFRELGYTSIDFSFGSQGKGADDAKPSDEDQTALADIEAPAEVEMMAVGDSSTGLDLRI